MLHFVLIENDDDDNDDSLIFMKVLSQQPSGP